MFQPGDELPYFYQLTNCTDGMSLMSVKEFLNAEVQSIQTLGETLQAPFSSYPLETRQGTHDTGCHT